MATFAIHHDTPPRCRIQLRASNLGSAKGERSSPLHTADENLCKTPPGEAAKLLAPRNYRRHIGDPAGSPLLRNPRPRHFDGKRPTRTSGAGGLGRWDRRSLGRFVPALTIPRVAHTLSFMYVPQEHRQHPCHRVVSVAGSAFLTAPDMKGNVAGSHKPEGDVPTYRGNRSIDMAAGGR